MAATKAAPMAKKSAVKKAPVKAGKKSAPIKKTVVKKSARKKPAPAAAQVPQWPVNASILEKPENTFALP